ncbi:Osmotically-inducible protein Y [Halioglobus japonicus]|nr:Osmotically-inducible protein Y [Halioglobus japonicus]
MKNMKSIRLACTTLALSSVLCVPTYAGQEANTTSEHVTTSSLERKASDAWREGKLDTIYLFNRHLNNFTIDPEVMGTDVVLTGKVESQVDKELAEQLALGVDGVTDVTNRLVVVAPEEARTGRSDGDRELSTKIEDATLTAEVKTRLLANEETDGLDINVDTVRNAVTLSGSVDSSAEKDLAGEIAQQVDGVDGVNNNLMVSES